MLPKYHIVIGAIATLILKSIFPITLLQATIIFLSSFLIDVDHYLLYIFKTKKLSPKKSVKYFIERRKKWLSLSLEERKKHKKAIFIFHGIETWSILALLALIHPLIWFVLLGILIHMILDYIDLINNKDPLYGKTSQLYVYFRNKGKKPFI